MSKIKPYRKKPVIIHAIEWNIDNLEEIRDFVGESLKIVINQKESPTQDLSNDTYIKTQLYVIQTDLYIKTLEGEMYVNYGDFIIRGVNGEFYPCKPDIFEKTYEEANEEDFDIINEL